MCLIEDKESDLGHGYKPVDESLKKNLDVNNVNMQHGEANDKENFT